MIELYYTGAYELNSVQKDPMLSLGNYKSSSMLPNDIIGNVFGDISMLSESKGDKECIGIIMKNAYGSIIDNIEMWFVNEEAGVTLEVAIVSVNQTTPVMEVLSTRRASPYNATFYSPDVDNKLSLPDPLAAGGYIGLWIRRTIDKDVYADAKSCTNIEDITYNSERDIQVSFIIDYDVS